MSLNIDDSAVKRIDELREKQGNDALMLRITVEGGGCSGFQYKMGMDDAVKDDDQVFAEHVVTDIMTMAFLKGSTIKFKDEMVGSAFIIDNPNAKASCGCGESFAT